MPFVPPLFKNFGKAAQDLFQDKIDTSKDDFKHTVKVVNPTSSTGMSVTSEATLNGSAVNGKSVLKYVHKCYGEGSVEVSDNSDLKMVAKLKGDKLQKGLLFNEEITRKRGAFAGKSSVEYSQEFLASSVELEVKDSVYSVNAQASAGYEGLSVGCKASRPLAGVAVEFLAGLSYSEADMSLCAKHNDKNGMTFSLHQKVNSTYSHAAGYSTGKDGDKLSLAASYVFDGNTNGKACLNIPRASPSSYSVTALLSHKLANPSASLDFKYHFVPESKATAFGVGVSFQ